MRRLDRAGYIARAPFGAVTFVDNPDTDLSPGEQIIGSKLLAYAYILTAEGYPSVYHKDYAQEPGCYGLKRWIDNLVWIHEHLANGATLTRFADQRVVALERQGWPGLLTAISNDPINRRAVTCQTSFPPGTQLHDYTGRPAISGPTARAAPPSPCPATRSAAGSPICASHGPARTRLRTCRGTGRCSASSVLWTSTSDRSRTAAPCVCRASTSWPTRRCTRTSRSATGAGRTRRASDWTSPGPTAAHSPIIVGGPQRAAADFRSRKTGWHTLELSGTGLPAATPFELEMSYRAPRTL